MLASSDRISPNMFSVKIKGVLVAYASIHGNTAKAAQKFAEMLRAKGVEKVSVMDLSRDDMAEVVEDAFRYDRMVLAAASYDGGVFPCMQDRVFTPITFIHSKYFFQF